MIFKQEGLDERLQYDVQLRNSLVDHFWDDDVSAESLMGSQAMERGDFASGEYAAKIRRNPNRIQVMLVREGNAWGVPLKITKGVTQTAGSSQIEIAYLIEGLPQDRDLHFGVDFNFAGIPDRQDDRYFSNGDGDKLGPMETLLDLTQTDQLNLTDAWLGLDVVLSFEQPTDVFAYPVQSVSQSESGFEAVHQAVCVAPHWIVRGDSKGCWSAKMTLDLQTDAAKHIAADQEAVSV